MLSSSLFKLSSIWVKGFSKGWIKAS
jgi:hypothetical protein